MKFILSTYLILFLQISFGQLFSDEFAIPQTIQYDWVIHKPNDTALIRNVHFPNNIHHILFEKKLIKDPYYGNNEKELEWIEQTNWIAEKDFIDEQPELPLKFLIIEGIEPYSRVYINNHFIFESDNSFKKYSFEISQYLISNKSNKLIIQFHPISKLAKEARDKNLILLPSDERIYTRKPQFEYGWDWGPRFITTGLNKSIEIVHRKKDYFELENTYSTTKSYNTNEAIVSIHFNFYSTIEQNIYVNYSAQDNKKVENKKIKLVKGNNSIILDLTVKNPDLWWPSQMGNQTMYWLYFNFSNKKYKKGGSRKDQHTLFKEVAYAFCDIKLIQNKDSIGTSFYFNVNGVPTYAKGFNIIPDDHLALTYNSLWYLPRIVENATMANANMIRVWGGGKYMDDEFYNTCLRYGIMVWQDFMFAGAMYPGDSNFLKNVNEEISQQVTRLRNYNNIALWCGNNEIDEAWNNWGWQKQYNYSKFDSTKIWNDYQNLFQKLIPTTLKQLIPNANYISTSPQIGWGRKESMTQGDSHYWGVWWGKEPIETFEKKIPRFMSEFGMQAMPDISTLKKVIADSVLNFNSPEFKNHQKHPTGFETLNHYLKEYLVVPKDLENYSYATQVLQAYTLKTAIESQRRAKPRCMGSLIWQLNDSWPVTSWSIIDYYSYPKLAFEEVQHSFQGLLLSVDKDANGFNIYIVKDDTNSIADQLTISILDFEGKSLFEKKLEVVIKGNSSKIYYRIKNEELKDINLTKAFLRCNLFKSQINSNYNFTKPNLMQLPKPEFDIVMTDLKLTEMLFSKTRRRYFDYYTIELTAKTYMPYVQLLKSDSLSIPHDFPVYTNYFPLHIVPGQKIVFQLPKAFFEKDADVKKVILENFKCLNSLMND